jgi:3-oxoacyl-(acyl-carrier-protein) synthase
VDLPLVLELLRDFRDTSLLSRNGVNDPFALEGRAATSGFLPGEAAVAVTLERGIRSGRALCQVEHYAANSDAYDALMIPEDGGGIADCVRAVMNAGDKNKLVAVCPHATGTVNHARVEPPALLAGLEGRRVPLLPLKPHTGHALGASGLLDVALLAACMKDGWLPAVLPGLTPPQCGLPLNDSPLNVKPGERLLKIASGMGGHNAAVSLAVL